MSKRQYHVKPVHRQNQRIDVNKRFKLLAHGKDAAWNISAETANLEPRVLLLCPNIKEQHVPSMRGGGRAPRLTDVGTRPMGARDSLVRNRKYAELPRSRFI